MAASSQFYKKKKTKNINMIKRILFIFCLRAIKSEVQLHNKLENNF